MRAATATQNAVAKKQADEQSAEARGLSLTGPDGLLRQLTKTVLDRLNEEMTENLGYKSTARPAPLGRSHC